MTYQHILYEVSDKIATITLNRPEAANTLNETLSSEMLDAIVSHKPVSDRARAHSKEELVTSAVKHLEQAVAIITKKATPPELADYRSFVNSLCAAVAAAHREGDAGVSPEESAVIDQVAAAMGNAT